MRISLSPFRSYSNFSIDIHEGSRTLVEGRSGVGKSTIFAAIFWCLYGSLQHVYPRGTTSQCNVQIEIGDMTILRSKKPDRLSLGNASMTLWGECAQKYIDSIFGDKETFIATSYIQQGSRCSLLSSSNAARMEFLNKISFTDINPQDVSETISGHLLPFNTNLSLMTSEYNSLISTWIPLEYKREDVSLDVDEMKMQIEELDTSLRHRRESVSRDNIARANRNSLMEQLRELEDKNSLLHFTDIASMNVEIENLQKSRVEWDLNKKNKSRLRQLKLPNEVGPPPSHEPSADEIASAEEREREYSFYRRQLSSIVDGEVTRELLESLNVELLNSIKYESSLNDRRDIKLVRDRIVELERIEVPLVKSDIYDLIRESKNRIENIKRSRDILECPQCSSNLRIEHGNLIECNEYKIDEAILDAERDNLTSLESQVIHLKRRASIDNELHNLREKERSIGERLEGIRDARDSSRSLRLKIDSVVRDLNILESMTIVEEPPISSSLLKEYKRYFVVKREIDNLKFNDVEFDPEYYNKLCRDRDVASRDNLKREVYISQIQSIERQISQIHVEEGLEDEVTRLEEMIREMKLKLERAIKANSLHSKYEYMMELHSKIESCTLHVRALTDLLDTTKRVESDLLESCVNGINDRMEMILGLIFEEPISVRLSLYKELKTKKTLKHQVNLSISYRGGEYDNISQLSGGEADRISFALSVALNSMTSSPLLLLDESFSSLDGEYRSSCVKSLSNLPGKTIIVISHEDVQGLYDYNITLI